VFALAALLGVDPEDVVTPALTTLDKTAIGAVLVVAVTVAVVAVWQLIRVQNARVEDQKAMSTSSAQLTEKLLEAFGKFSGALDRLKEAETGSQRVTSDLKAAVTAMTNQLNLLLVSFGPGAPGPRSRTPSGMKRVLVPKEAQTVEKKEREGEGE
jgi:hypothetical protein